MTKKKFKKVCNTARDEIISYYSNEELQKYYIHMNIGELCIAKIFMIVVQMKLMKNVKAVMDLIGKNTLNQS